MNVISHHQPRLIAGLKSNPASHWYNLQATAKHRTTLQLYAQTSPHVSPVTHERSQHNVYCYHLCRLLMPHVNHLELLLFAVTPTPAIQRHFIICKRQKQNKLSKACNCKSIATQRPPDVTLVILAYHQHFLGFLDFFVREYCFRTF